MSHGWCKDNDDRSGADSQAYINNVTTDMTAFQITRKIVGYLQSPRVSRELSRAAIAVCDVPPHVAGIGFGCHTA